MFIYANQRTENPSRPTISVRVRTIPTEVFTKTGVVHRDQSFQSPAKPADSAALQGFAEVVIKKFVKVGGWQ